VSLFSNNSSSFKVAITLVSQVWTAAIGIIFTPVYIRLIGVESFGLVAFFTSLAASLVILDLGLSTAVSRQLSIMKADGSSLMDQRTLLFSIERVYWAIAVILGLAIIALSYPIAVYWVNSRELPTTVIQHAVMLMGVAFAFQWPNSIYAGSLTGLQQQSRSAVIAIIYATLRVVIMILALKFISPTIECFFIVQIAVTIIQSTMFRVATWRQLRLSGHHPKFSREQLRKIKKFAAGITGISLVSFTLTQIDKLVVSKMVLLEFVGYYNLAFVLANVMITIVSPMQAVFFPKFSALVAAGKQQEIVELFYKTGRWVAIIVMPVGGLLVIFSKEILFLWTKNAVLAENTAPVLRFAAIGTVCNTLMWVPYFYMLAKGITKFTIYQNIIASVVLTPLLFWFTAKYGTVGASLVWFIVNLGYVIISLPLFHHLYFKGHLKNWYINNLFRPVLVAIPLLYFLKMLLDKVSFHYTYFSFGLVLVFIGVIYCLATKEIRLFALEFYNKKLKRS
jgi:O-antigen/teichoic acid export membrane protein